MQINYSVAIDIHFNNMLLIRLIIKFFKKLVKDKFNWRKI